MGSPATTSLWITSHSLPIAEPPANQPPASSMPPKKTQRKAKPEKKQKKVKDPNAPKRPMSAYFPFMNEVRDATKAENPGLKIGDIAKLLGERWGKKEEEEEKEEEKEEKKKDDARSKKRKANATLPK